MVRNAHPTMPDRLSERSHVDTLFKVNQLMDDFDYFAAAGMA
jgi:hypothetical protein